MKATIFRKLACMTTIFVILISLSTKAFAYTYTIRVCNNKNFSVWVCGYHIPANSINTLVPIGDQGFIPATILITSGPGSVGRDISFNVSAGPTPYSIEKPDLRWTQVVYIKNGVPSLPTPLGTAPDGDVSNLPKYPYTASYYYQYAVTLCYINKPIQDMILTIN